MDTNDTIIVESTLVSLDPPVVLTEDDDEKLIWPIEVQFYFGQGLYGERDADLAAAGKTVQR